MSKMGKFVFGSMESDAYGIVITQAPPIAFAERETEAISVPGYSGDLHIDMGRYKNVTVSYQCALIPHNGQTLRQTAIKAVSAMHAVLGYNKLINDFDDDTYRMARIGSAISAESIVEKAGIFTIDFDCAPQRFLLSGEIVAIFTTAGILRNPTVFPAKPLITIYGTSAGEVSVGGVTVEIKEIEDQITLDCDLQDAYRQAADSGPENYNGKIYAPKFPELLPGDNGISFTGGITKVEIIPRWWTL